MWFPSLLLLATSVTTTMSERSLRAEEVWRPASPRDLGGYRARQARLVTEEADRATTSTMSLPLAKSPYIVGGSPVSRHSRPWLAAVFIDSAWFCSGSLVYRLNGTPRH